MKTHPYLRAYLAGTFVPTLVLPLLLVVFIVARVVMRLPVPIEQGMIFPMAVVPLLWGVWNIGWQALQPHTRVSIGAHGAVLPLVLAPLGGETAHALGVLQFGATGLTWFHMLTLPYGVIAPGFLGALVLYYLAWKYIVGFLNRVLGIA
jgi:hypothetical protein